MHLFIPDNMHHNRDRTLQLKPSACDIRKHSPACLSRRLPSVLNHLVLVAHEQSGCLVSHDRAPLSHRPLFPAATISTLVRAVASCLENRRAPFTLRFIFSLFFLFLFVFSFCSFISLFLFFYFFFLFLPFLFRCEVVVAFIISMNSLLRRFLPTTNSKQESHARQNGEMCSRFLQRQLLRMVSEVTIRLAFPGGCVQCRVADLQRKVIVETENSPKKARTFRVSAAKKRCIANASALLSDQSASACFEHRKKFTPCCCCYFPIFYSLLVMLLLPNILLPSLT